MRGYTAARDRHSAVLSMHSHCRQTGGVAVGSQWGCSGVAVRLLWGVIQQPAAGTALCCACTRTAGRQGGL